MLAALASAAGRVTLTLYGPIGDQRYWRTCQEAVRRLPDQVSVHYRGEVCHQDVPARLARHQVFVLPSKG
ncbi:MAG: glycosyl transferase family 1, partial [Gammaproteobacteria bacterium]|nr:glycosyl transferase family 1 [Gammaproteobacteria bacterium]